MTINLNILEIEILLYLLNARTALGPHAESVKKKLNAARRAELERTELLSVEMEEK